MDRNDQEVLTTWVRTGLRLLVLEKLWQLVARRTREAGMADEEALDLMQLQQAARGEADAEGY